MLGVVFLNLLEGVAIGFLAAIWILLIRITRIRIETRVWDNDGVEEWQVEVNGTLSFLSLPKLTKALVGIPPEKEVALIITADYIDHSVAEAISDWKHAYEASGGAVEVIESSHEKLHTAHHVRPRRHFTSSLVISLVAT